MMIKACKKSVFFYHGNYFQIIVIIHVMLQISLTKLDWKKNLYLILMMFDHMICSVMWYVCVLGLFFWKTTKISPIIDFQYRKKKGFFLHLQFIAIFSRKMGPFLVAPSFYRLFELSQPPLLCMRGCLASRDFLIDESSGHIVAFM